MKNCKPILTGLLLFLVQYVSAQDSLHVSLDQADKLFLQQNLLLAAGQLNVDAQKAQEIQAQLYPNPQFSAGINVYDDTNRELFYIGRKGEKSFEFDQLLLLGGKRKNQIDLARQNTRLAQLELEDLLRNLKYSLHTRLYSVYFDLLTVKRYDQQLQQLDSIITSYTEQAQKGNIALKEVVRLKSVFIGLNNDRSELLQSIQGEQKDLQLLLQTDRFVVLAPFDLPEARLVQLPPIDSLKQLALHYRADLRSALLSKSIADINIRYQKSLARPDITLGTSFDQHGNAFPNQYMFTIGLPLPFWNRNQGNIRSAEIGSRQALLNQQFQESAVGAEVVNAWRNMQQAVTQYQRIRELYNSDFNTVFDGITENFRKRNISLLEFVDFLEAHNSTVAEINRARKQLLVAAETINYTVALPVF